MREILFRGKQVNNGEWIQGDLLQNVDCLKIREQEKDIKHISRSFVVLTETICQYTGLTDKNGKKIFEGDIVKYKNTDGASYRGITLTVVGKVVYNNKTASFAVDGKDQFSVNYDYFPIKDVEIIGNIHDNPELMKGGSE